MRGWRAVGVVAAVLVMAAGTVALTLNARATARNDAASQRARDVDLAASAVSSTVGTTLLRADDAAAFLGGAPVNAAQWQIARSRLFADPALFGAGVALAFSDRQRSAVEHRLGRPLQEPGPGGTLRAARRHARYVVPIYVAYRGGGAAGLGVNLAAEPQRGATFRRAAQLGRGQLTAPVALVGSADQMIVVVYSPIRARGGLGDVTGYVIASYRTEQLIARARSVLGHDVRFRLSDAGTAFAASATPLTDPKFRTLEIGGRRLTLAVGRPAISYDSSIAIAAGGATITVLVLLLLSLATRGERRAVAGREALRASELRYRTVVSALGEGVIVRRADGMIESCNPAAERILGQSAEQLMTGHVSVNPSWAAVHDDGSPFPHEDYPPTVTLRTGVPQHGVIMGLHRPDGSPTWLSVDSEVLRPEGDPAGAAVFTAFADITDQRDAEQRLRARTSELERVNQELETFAYSVSHDLRAPLRAINGFSELLREDHGDQLGPNGRHHLERIRAAAMLMGNLIEGILQLSRLSRRPFAREPVDLSDLARQIAAELQQSQPDRHIEFVIQDGLVADADEVLVRTVLMNLLANAYKFTSKTDSPLIRFGVDQQDDISIYLVADNGAGFDPAHAKQLFMPFHRLHRDSEFPGEGIGLATVARAVSRHGGAIWALGAVDKGATFYFSLTPGARPPETAVTGADVIPAWLSTEGEESQTIDDAHAGLPVEDAGRGCAGVALDSQ